MQNVRGHGRDLGEVRGSEIKSAIFAACVGLALFGAVTSRAGDCAGCEKLCAKSEAACAKCRKMCGDSNQAAAVPAAGAPKGLAALSTDELKAKLKEEESLTGTIAADPGCGQDPRAADPKKCATAKRMNADNIRTIKALLAERDQELILESMSGVVDFESAGGKVRRPAEIGMKITRGDCLYVAKDGRAMIRLGEARDHRMIQVDGGKSFCKSTGPVSDEKRATKADTSHVAPAVRN